MCHFHRRREKRIKKQSPYQQQTTQPLSTHDTLKRKRHNYTSNDMMEGGFQLPGGVVHVIQKGADTTHTLARAMYGPVTFYFFLYLFKDQFPINLPDNNGKPIVKIQKSPLRPILIFWFLRAFWSFNYAFCFFIYNCSTTELIIMKNILKIQKSLLRSV